ncbi:vitamin K epoxide reductase family protein [Rudanella lutea]|uniref:vitamin K epoxide reductase family protein n=1 Tax=Rudanella lutea TaxID=451374 RepID=UPI00037640FF|nr:vitamin K epoxide reductase family protein [Rudanella lutea]
MKLTPVEKNAYDALAYLIQVARLPITAKTVKEELYLHPDFPSLLAMSDLLTEWKVSNLATRIRPEQLVEIPLPAIVYLEINGGYFAPVRKVTNERVEWLDTQRGWQTDSLTDFSRKWNGVILLIEPDESSGEANYQQKKREAALQNARLPMVIGGLILCLICMGGLFLPQAVFNNGPLWGLLLTKLTGIVVTTLLLWSTIDADNSLLRSLCSLDNRTDCNSVLTSKAAKLWGWLGWAEIGFTYFAGSFLALLMGLSTAQPAVLSWLIVLNVLALPYTLYSVYYQYRVAKSWCTLCLLVQVLLWAEFALGAPHWQSITPVVNGQTIALFGLAFLVPIIGWVFLKKPLQDATQVFPLRRELQRAKFNPEYVESLFTRQPQMPPIFEGMRVVTMGNPEAEHTLTVVTNPLCGPCRRLHPQLEALVERTDTINCQFVFIGSAESVAVTQKLLSLSPDDAERAMHLWYTRNDHDSIEWRKGISPSEEFVDARQQLQLHARWSELAQVVGTPTLYLNGRQIPLTYTLNDLENLCRNLRAAPQPTELADSYKSIV